MKNLMQENMSWMMKKLGEANPHINIDIGDFCAPTTQKDTEM